jgi:hypothetical protein
MKTPVVQEFSTSPTSMEESASTFTRFQHYVEEWREQTRFMSSSDGLVSNINYQKIVGLGWPVVPFLLRDLRESKGFWFVALQTITGITPFDSRDAGNSKRMVAAWLAWGSKKQLI